MSVQLQGARAGTASPWTAADPWELAGKVVLITGAGSGIGRAAAHAFVAAGARVVLAGRRSEKLEDTAAGVDAAQRLVVPCDVADESQVEDLVAGAVAHFGRLDGAFHSAGTFGRFGPLHEDARDNFDEVVAVNLRGLWNCLRHELAAMLRGDGGAIVNCASLAGHYGHLQSAVYSATKHAVVGLTRSVALQYAAVGIRANVVSPGSTDTEMLRAVYPDPEVLATRASRAPVGRLGRPEEVARTALWLTSPLSSYITGQVVVVDGGVSAGAGSSPSTRAGK